jgi:hypothetical protein
MKVSSILISLGSAIFAVYWILKFASSTSPDRVLFVAPLFFCGLPLTIIGNVFGFVFQLAGKGLWYYELPIIICYFIQWQFIARWLYRKSVYV